MTDEQFKQLMDKLDEIARQRQAPIYIGYPAPNPVVPTYPAPQPWQPYDDGLPPHWRHTVTD